MLTPTDPKLRIQELQAYIAALQVDRQHFVEGVGRILEDLSVNDPCPEVSDKLRDLHQRLAVGTEKSNTYLVWRLLPLIKDKLAISTPNGVLEIDEGVYGQQDDSLIIRAVPVKPRSPADSFDAFLRGGKSMLIPVDAPAGMTKNSWWSSRLKGPVHGHGWFFVRDGWPVGPFASEEKSERKRGCHSMVLRAEIAGKMRAALVTKLWFAGISIRENGYDVYYGGDKPDASETYLEESGWSGYSVRFVSASTGE